MKTPEHIDADGSSSRDADFYRLLRIDPDAPQELVAEAYWCAAEKLRAQMPRDRDAERELPALNAAYAVLVDPEQRAAYDETVARVVALRRERAERDRARQKRPLLSRLFGKQRHADIDCFELLRLDPAAEPALIARAYLVMRSLCSRGEIAGSSAEQMALLERARGELLERAVSDKSSERRTTGETDVESPAPPEFLTIEHDGAASDERTLERQG